MEREREIEIERDRYYSYKITIFSDKFLFVVLSKSYGGAKYDKPSPLPEGDN